MNGFLLLRDNKQTGPYSAVELKNMGLKPYDLIWQEGKSAAWRYPGEIPDLSSFAPKVEEQPYDRFFKKPAAEEKQTLQETVVETKQAELVAKSGSVFVELPDKVQAARPAYKEPIKSSPVEKVEVADKTYSKPVEYIKFNSTNAVLPTLEAPAETTLNSTRPASKKVQWSTYDIAMRGIIAICMILIGFIVAMYIFDLRSGNGEPPAHVQVDEGMENTAGMNFSTLLTEEEPEQVTEPIAPQPTITKTPVPVKKPVTKTAPVTTAVQKQPVVEEIPAEPEVPELSAEELQNLKKQVMAQVNLETNPDYKIGAFGGVEDLTILLTNNSNEALNHVAVRVNFYNQNRKSVRTQNLSFYNVNAGEAKKLEVPKSNRGVEFSVELVAVELAKE